MKRKSLSKHENMPLENQIGFAIIVGIIFAVMGFLGSVCANFLWWWQQNHPKTIIFTGVASVLTFLGLIIWLITIAKKYLR